MSEVEQIIDFGNAMEVLTLAAALFAIVFVRYVVVSAIFFGLFYMVWPKKFRHRKVTDGSWKNAQFRKELRYSAITSAIFAISGVVMLWAWQLGYTAVYTAISAYGYVWFVLSFFLALFIHETYYYWLHRLMHHPAIFRSVHKVHHESIISSPWTAFSFHPWESILQALIVPLIVLVLPMHVYTILALFISMTLSAVINHLGIEIYPAGFKTHWLGKLLIGATHHSLHHSEFRSNFGLYFTFWDKWMGTESSKFEKLFAEKTRNPTGQP